MGTSRFMSFPFNDAGLPVMLPWVWLNPPVYLLVLCILKISYKVFEKY